VKIFGKYRLDILYRLGFVSIILLALLETIKFPGVVYKYTHVKIEWLIILFLLVSCKIKEPIAKKKNLITVSSLIFGLCLFLSLMEAFYYPNFVLSKLHIHVYGVQLLFFIMLSSLLPFLIANKNTLEKIGLILLIYWTVSNVLSTVSFAMSRVKPIIKSPRASYDEKMRRDWGGFYDCMKLIKNNTLENASIYIPPQTDVWQMEGNEYLVRYFLYPREILHFGKISEATKSANPYFLYSWGYYAGDRKSGAWPYENIESVWGKFVEEGDNYDGSKPIVFDRNLMKNRETCGVIKPIFK